MVTLITPEIAPFLTLAVVVGMFVLFARETYPTEVVALAGAAILLLSGILEVEHVLSVFSNPAPWTIAAMFILSGGLVRTGALKAISDFAAARAKGNPVLVICAFAGLILIASAFINNTPVVVMMIPVAMQLAKTIGTTGSRLLIPLSYTAIFGGMLTLIGTSTNLLVDGVAQARGLDAFSLFEVTPLAIILAAIGMIYLRLAAPRLLPDRHSMSDMLGKRKSRRFLTQMFVPEDSPLIGQTVSDVAALRRADVRLVDVLRGDESLRRQIDGVALEQGDRLVLRTGVSELLSLKDEDGLNLAGRVDSKESTTVEVLITPGARVVGRNLGDLRLRRRYGVYVIALHRKDQNIGAGLDTIRVRVGDTLLLEGAEADIARLAADMDLLDISQPSDQPYRRAKAPLVLVALAAVVLFSALKIMPIFGVALIAVAFILLTRCIDAEEAFAAVDGRLLALIFSMLAVGAALERSGAVTLIVDALGPRISALPPPLIVWVVYLMTSVLTELVSNNAVAVAITPVAIGLATALGIDPRPLVVAVMVAASASFATPIGYQTNTLVYGPGGYRFSDFLRIGVPLNLLIGAVASFLIPVFFPF